jgi:hypothetical protein
MAKFGKLQSGRSVSWPGFDPLTARTEIRNVAVDSSYAILPCILRTVDVIFFPERGYILRTVDVMFFPELGCILRTVDVMFFPELECILRTVKTLDVMFFPELGCILMAVGVKNLGAF